MTRPKSGRQRTTATAWTPCSAGTGEVSLSCAGPVVDLALELANLTWKEELAITECARRDKTQERAAEDNGYSVDTMQRWYRRGIAKLCRAWGGVWWVEKLAE